MKDRFGLALVLSTVVLTGCMSAEEMRTRDEQICRDYGFHRRNDAFAACLQRLDLDRRAQSRANQAALADMERDFRYRQYWRRSHQGPHRTKP